MSRGFRCCQGPGVLLVLLWVAGVLGGDAGSLAASSATVVAVKTMKGDPLLQGGDFVTSTASTLSDHITREGSEIVFRFCDLGETMGHKKDFTAVLARLDPDVLTSEAKRILGQAIAKAGSFFTDLGKSAAAEANKAGSAVKDAFDDLGDGVDGVIDTIGGWFDLLESDDSPYRGRSASQSAVLVSDAELQLLASKIDILTVSYRMEACFEVRIDECTQSATAGFYLDKFGVYFSLLDIVQLGFDKADLEKLKLPPMRKTWQLPQVFKPGALPFDGDELCLEIGIPIINLASIHLCLDLLDLSVVDGLVNGISLCPKLNVYSQVLDKKSLITSVTYAKAIRVIHDVVGDFCDPDAPQIGCECLDFTYEPRCHVLNETVPAVLVKSFSALDANNNLEVTRDEYQAGVKRLGVGVDAAVVDTTFTTLDVDGSNSLSFEEIHAAESKAEAAQIADEKRVADKQSSTIATSVGLSMSAGFLIGIASVLFVARKRPAFVTKVAQTPLRKLRRGGGSGKAVAKAARQMEARDKQAAATVMPPKPSVAGASATPKSPSRSASPKPRPPPKAKTWFKKKGASGASKSPGKGNVGAIAAQFQHST